MESPVEQVAGVDVAEGAQHRVLDLGMLDLELGDEALDALALQAQVAASRAAAADDRQLRRLRVGARFWSTSRIWISAQLSLPPESPTITRSPCSISRCSVIALVTFLAILVSRSDE